MESNKKVLNFRDIILIFLPIFCAILIQYGTNLCDMIIIFVGHITDKSPVNKNLSLTEILNNTVKQPMNQAYLTLATYSLYILVFGIWYKRAFCPNPVRSYLKLPDKSAVKKAITIAVCLLIAGALAQIFVDGAMALARPHFPDIFKEYDEHTRNVTGAGASLVMYFTVFFVAPVGEELLFRGLIFRYSKKVIPAVCAILLNAVVFGLYHSNSIQIIYALFMGIVLCTVANKFDSILPSILLHMSVNCSMILVRESWFENHTRTIIITALGFVLFVSLIIFILIFEQKNKLIRE